MIIKEASSKSFIIDMKRVNVERVLLFFLTFFLFFFPSTSSWIRLGLLVMLAFVVILGKSYTVRGGGIKPLVCFVLINSLFMFLGIINGAGVEAIKVQTIDILWPVLFFFSLSSIDDESDFDYLLHIMVICEGITATFDAISVGCSFLGITVGGIWRDIQEIQHYAYGDLGGFFQYFSRCQTTHMFMFPFLILMNCVDQKIVKKPFLIYTTLVSALCYIFSGRVAFIISVIISVISCLTILLAVKKIKISKDKIMLGIVGFVLVLFAVVFVLKSIDLRLDAVINYIKFKIETSNNADHANGVRLYQKLSLISGWLESPIIGHGSGIYSENIGGYVWSKRGYEYTYYMILFQKGIIGFLNYFLFYGWIVIVLLKRSFKGFLDLQYSFPMVAGMVSILIVSYADPYLLTMGSTWMIFFPFAIANRVSIRGRKEI